MALIFCLSVLLFVLGLFTKSFSELISLKPPHQDRTDVIAKRSKLPFGYRCLSPIHGAEPNNELALLDVVLLASVDGKFHALNRTSGQVLWSMASSPSLSTRNAVPPALRPLVRTTHVENDPELTDDDGPDQELYIVEPQSGDIYVMSSSGGPLQRLSLTMSQLVDSSPFSFAGDEKYFVGKKETSLLLLELETGRIKASLNTECPWDPFEDLYPDAGQDIDELDGHTERSAPTEIHIGRTDYLISIITKPRGSFPRPPTQNLSFSTYGANNQHSGLQAAYHRTPDDTYIQTLPNGVIVCLKAATADGSELASPFLWHQRFSSPIVAVFDVLTSPGQPQPFVLQQPQPRLQDVLPGRMDHLPHRDSAYVGMVKETGSLFAMTPDRFPLVAFSDADPQTSVELIDPRSGSEPHDPSGQRATCRTGSPDRTCLTGIRPLAEDSRSRFSRLLDGTPSVELPPEPLVEDPALPDNASIHSNTQGWNNLSIVPTWVWGLANHSSSSRDVPLGLDGAAGALSSAGSVMTALLLGLIWIVYQRFRSSKRTQIPVTIKQNGIDIPSVQGVQLEQADSPSSMSRELSHPRFQLSIAEMDPRAGMEPSEVQLNGHPVLENHVLDEVRDDGEDSDKDGEGTPFPNKRKGRRGKRGKKKKVTVVTEDDVEKVDMTGKAANGIIEHTEPPLTDAPVPPATLVVPSAPKSPSDPSSPLLVVSDTILGYGSHGTVVFQGSLQGRSVAVKRLLKDFVTLASREVSILQESDDHPNVIRYYYQEAHASFLYIALELCPASLADVIESPDQFLDISVTFDPKRALRQITSGLRHLHGLMLVHRDIKPQNILISSAKSGTGRSAGHRMLISDFGLCKKLDVDQTSFLPTAHGSGAVGTVGWRAPEILRGEVKLDDVIGDDHSLSSSRGSVGTPDNGSSATGKPTRLTKAVDIFSLGCLFYYTLTNGGHPFGDRFEREMNILKDLKSLDGLERFGEEGSEGADLIRSMLHPEAQARPNTTACLVHPFFWDPARRLTFLQDASDRFEIMCRDPRDPNLIALETDAINIVGNDWHTRLDKVFIENLGKFRKYDGRSVQDLLRALRNKKHHYQDLPDNVKRNLGIMPDGFLAYFTRRFPRLILHVHSVIGNSSLHQESMFRSYFELVDP